MQLHEFLMILQTRPLFTTHRHLPDSLDLVVNIDNIYVPFTCVATSSQNIPQLLRRNTL